ncbi:MAG: COG1361 S-layer family protein [Candidatus Woesearchaeota archaeon]
MIKNIMSVLALALALVISASGAAAVGGGMVTASILRYEPTPAEQGNTVDVWVQLSNQGTKADRVVIKFVPEYPFSLAEGVKGEVDVGTIAAIENKVVKFTLYIDPNAPNGDNNVKFLYKYGTIDQWVQFEAPITLQTQNAVMVIDDYKVEPETVVPGQTFGITLKMRNAGRIGVKNLDVGIDLEDGIFSTIGSGTKKRIDFVGAGETETVTFSMASDPSTAVKVYSIPLSLSYQDERSKQYTDTAKVSLVVNTKPEISVTVDSTKFRSKTSPGTVSLKIVNKGIVNMKYVSVRLVETPDYEVLSSSNEAYVGNLDSDDFETVDFTIKPKVSEPRLNVQLEFKDPYNVGFKESYNLPLRIITAKELGNGGFPWGWIVLAVIVVGGIIYWRIRKKKKR